VREIRSLGSVEGARGNSRPYSDTPYGAHGLDRLAVEPRDGIYVMAGGREGCSRQDRTMRDISPTPNIAMTIGGHLRIYCADVTTAGCSRAEGLCRARAETAQTARQWLRHVSGKHGDERQVDG
jgi:hypothetical protein